MKAVSDGLRRLEGVAQVRVALQENIVTIEPAQQADLDLAAIPRAVRESGFDPGAMTILARGRVERDAVGASRFRIDGSARPIALATELTGEGLLDAELDHADGEVRIVAARWRR